MYDPKNPTVSSWHGSRKVGAKTTPKQVRDKQKQLAADARRAPIFPVVPPDVFAPQPLRG